MLNLFVTKKTRNTSSAKKSFFLGLFLCAFFLAQPVWAQKAVGVLQLKQGLIAVTSSQGRKTLTQSGQQVPIFEKDEIQTGKNTRAILILEGKKDIIELYSQTLLQLAHITAQSTVLKLPLGKAKFQLQTQTQADPNWEFKVRVSGSLLLSQSDPLSPQGSIFLIQTQGKTRTQLMTLEGHVRFISSQHLKDGVDVYSQQVSRIQGNKKPAFPSDISSQIVQKIIHSEEGTQWDTLKEIIQKKRIIPKKVPILTQKEQSLIEKSHVSLDEIRVQKQNSDHSNKVIEKTNAFLLQSL